MIICDTRERKNNHVLDYFERHGIPFQIKKLDTGDYFNPSNPTVVIDRKMNLGELATNLASKDSSRFWRELKRSKQEGKKFVVLCEHGGKIKTMNDVVAWKNPYGRIHGKELAQKMFEVEKAYKVEFVFCSKRSTGKRIWEILYGNKR